MLLLRTLYLPLYPHPAFQSFPQFQVFQSHKIEKMYTHSQRNPSPMCQKIVLRATRSSCSWRQSWKVWKRVSSTTSSQEGQATDTTEYRWLTKEPMARAPCSCRHWRSPVLLAKGRLYRMHQADQVCSGLAANRQCLQVMSKQAARTWA